MARKRLEVVQPGPVTVRHIVDGVAGSAGAVVLNGRSFVPQDKRGVNGRNGFISGVLEPRLGEEGTATLTLPNTIGDKGGLHRDRFLIIQRGKRRPAPGASGATIYEGGSYRPGDEWLEIYQDEHDLRGQLTPTRAKVDRSTVELTLVDGFWLLNKARETAAGFWHHAPRDALEHYSRVWDSKLVSGFEGAVAFSYSGTEQTSSDGQWDYVNASTAFTGQKAVRILPFGAAADTGYLRGDVTVAAEIGAAATDHAAWRFECRFARGGLGAGAILQLGLRVTGTAAYILFEMTPAELATIVGDGTAGTREVVRPHVESGEFHIAIEGRGRWLFFYFDGALVTVRPMIAGSNQMVPYIWHKRGSTTVPGDGAIIEIIDVKNVLFWRTEALLMRGADRGAHWLPGQPTSGGLIGTYFSDRDLATKHGTDAYLRCLNPTREPTARRLDANLPWSGLSPENWAPTGLPGADFSVRWTGSIYLDLAANDFKLQTVAGDRARVWVGKTRIGEQIIDDWTSAGHAGTATTTSAYLRSILGTTSGWYPIVIEFSQDAVGAGISLQWANDTAPTTFADVPATALSPDGIFEGRVRGESHYDQYQAIASTFGYQFRCEPRQLESGLFPGECVPRARVGRDTNHVLDSVQAREISAEVSAEDTADVLLADAQGIAADGAQLTAQLVNYSEVGNHMLAHTEYEQVADITSLELLLQRLDSYLTLRGGTWESITAQPDGLRRLVDTFPQAAAGFLLSGVLAEFRWEPGDAVLMCFPEIGVEDTYPRPILGVSWPFVPDGFGAPAVSWRQRQRSGLEVLRRMMRGPLRQARNYQGQFVTVPGSIGGLAGADAYSRVNLPTDLSTVVKVELVVQAKSDGSTKTIEVNGAATGRTFVAPGRHDITDLLARADANQGPRMYARATGGTGTAEHALELLVAV